MKVDVWMIIAMILAGLSLLLSILILLYWRQMKSICRQLRVHRTEHSGTDIWLDIVKGPFCELQKEINLNIREQRKEQKEHREQEQAFKELVSNVSHDIRTPITSVSGYFQLFMDTEDEEKRRQYADIINGRLRDFSSMLEDFYEYSTAVSNDRKPVLEKCDVTRAVSECLFLYYKEIGETLGEPILHFPEREIYAFASDQELRRVLQNIISNALRHGCGSLRVSVEAAEAEHRVRLRFENQTAEPIPEKPDKVFERTYKADAARTGGGSGLGLCIAKELTEKMGGGIAAYSLENNMFGILIELEKWNG